MDNMRIYNAGRKVPAEAQKPINAGRLKGMTDINPMWRIRQLTELFGPCGVGWWYEITGKQIVQDEVTKQASAFADILLYYIDPGTGEISKPIPGTGGSAFVAQERNGPYLSDECYKMALTDAISVAAKALGIGADVYWAGGRSKYSGAPEAAPTAPQSPPVPRPDVLFTCDECKKQLRPYISPVNGAEVSIRKHVEGSKAKFGRILCADCISKLARPEP